MARVWPNVFVEPANLTVHMSALRRRCVTVGMGIASRRRCRRGPLAKPLLVSGDLKIIDGNRRWATNVRNKHLKTDALLLGSNFRRCVSVIRALPKAYGYKDPEHKYRRTF